MPSVPFEDLKNLDSGESSEIMRRRVEAARKTQLDRQGKANSQLDAKETEKYCMLEQEGEALIRRAIASLSLSARAYHRVLRMARSIADLQNMPTLSRNHVAEAIQYRRFEV